MERRTFVKGLSAIGVAVGFPVAAKAKTLNIEDYPIESRAEYHASQLARSLTARHGGVWFAKVDDCNKCALVTSNERTPDERIETALAELEAALKVKYPTFDVRHHRGQSKMAYLGSDKTTVMGEYVGIYLGYDLHPNTELCMCLDDGPLRADDVTGTNAFADYLAEV